jgi:outer membrane receptor protein involved in Fe transport
LNTAWFFQAQVKPSEKVKLIGGMRGDYFRNDIDNRFNPENSGIGQPSIVCPKFGIVLTPVENINVFANRGIGFRSPAASDVSPPSGPTNFELDPALTESWDIGLNATFLGNIYLAFDYYRTNKQDEIRTIDGEQVNIGNSERSGFEIESRFYASKELMFFANYAWVDAIVTNPVNPGQDRITGIAEHVVKTGVEFNYRITPDITFLGDVYYEFLSGQPCYFGTDPTVFIGPDYDSYNLKFACKGINWGVFLTTRIQPREYSAEYVSASGNDIIFAPKPFADLTAGLKYTF